MSSDEITLTVEERTVIGKGVKHLRYDGLVPAVIHNHGQASTHVMAPYTDMLKVYKQAGKHHPVSVKVGGKAHLTIIKDADFEPRKHELRHVVFNAIRLDQTVEAEVPVRLSGDMPAEKASLMVITDRESVEIEAIPAKLPDELVVDATVLADVGDKIHASNITLPEGVALMTEPEAVIAHVEMPRDQIAEADAAAAEMAAEKAAAEGDEGAEPAEEAATEETEGEGEEESKSAEEKPAE